MRSLNDIFSSKDFIPHGYCLTWSSGLLWLHVISDLLITLSYYSIPLVLVYFIRRRKDFPYPWLVTMFAGFIVACGTTHLLSIITVWVPLYWLDGVIKAFTALISVATAVLMVWIIPRVLSLPSAGQLQTEILQRNAAEQALRESEYRWKFAIEGAGDGLWDWDVVSNKVFFSKCWKEMLGFAEHEVGNSPEEWEKRIHPEDKENILNLIHSYCEGVTPNYISEHRLRCKDGSYKWILTRGMTVCRSQDGKPQRIIGTHTDISERKQMDQKLRDSEAFNSSILNSLTSHIAVLDNEGVIVSVNEAWLNFAKENSAQAVSQHWLGLNYLDICKTAFNRPDGDEANAAYLGIKSVLTGEHNIFHLEYPCHSPDEQRWFYMTVSPLQGSRGGVVVRHVNITEHKLAERILVQLKAMVDISLDGFWIVDTEGHLLQVNEAYARMSGYLIDELMSMNISQLEAQENPEQIKSHIAKTATHGYDFFETQHRHKDGHIIDVEISVAFLSEFQHFCVFCRDITERKKMEGELRASEAKFRLIIEASPVPMVLSDEQSKITFLNPAFVRTFGYSLSDIPNLEQWSLQAYPDPTYRRWVKQRRQALQDSAKRGETDLYPLELEVRCKNNRIKNVLVTIAPVYQDSVGNMVAILYDITQRKQIEAKLNSIFNASVEAIITVDTSDYIVSANAAVETVFGYKPDELVECHITKLIRALPRVKEHGSAVVTKSTSQIQEVEGIHKNGHIVPVDVSIAEYSIDDTSYFTYIARDVSSRKNQEHKDKEHLDQLAHVTRLGLMGELASGIAHEVNQPLSAVSSYTDVSLQLINAENPDLVLLSEVLDKTRQQALRAGAIIHRMREFVKSHSKHRSTADINALIHNANSLCVAELKKNNIELAFELQAHLPPVFVDQIQIEQVIINLIRNSIDALKTLPSTRHRHLTILSQLAEDGGIVVSVKDNGAGMDLNQQQKIMMPFYTTKTDGVGMGLSISRSILEAHGGSLYFNSEYGKGSTFYFRLPQQAHSDEL